MLKSLMFGISILILSVLTACEAQRRAVSPKQSQEQQIVTTSDANAEGQRLLRDLKIAESNVFNCYYEYYKKSSKPDAETVSKCVDSRTIELAKIYGDVSKSTVAIQLMLSKEMDDHLENSVLERADLNRNLESLMQLQRIMVVQNQRIIELLERPTDK